MGDVWMRKDMVTAVYPPWRHSASCTYLLLPALATQSEEVQESSSRQESWTKAPKTLPPRLSTTSRRRLSNQCAVTAGCDSEGEKHLVAAKSCSGKEAMGLQLDQAVCAEVQVDRPCKVIANRAQQQEEAVQAEVSVAAVAATPQAITSKDRQMLLPPWLCAPSRRRRAEKCAETAGRSLRAPDVNMTLPGRHEEEEAARSDEEDQLAFLEEPRVDKALTADKPLQDAKPCQLAAEEVLRDNQARGRTVIVSAPVSAKQYQGYVKYFRGTFGWVECGEVAKIFPNCDVFVHINDCDFRPRQWDKVCFQLAEDDQGKPKAVKVSLG